MAMARKKTRIYKQGEKELRVFRQSPMRLCLDLSFIVLAFILIGVLLSLSVSFSIIEIFILLVVMAMVGFAAYLNWYFTIYIITSVRVEYQVGIIGRYEEEIALEDIQTVNTHQDIIGRIFAHGDILIESAGMKTIILKNVRHAHRIAHEIATLSLEYNQDVSVKIPRGKQMFVD